MFNLPNAISLVRFPLALLFLHENAAYRCLILALAGLSDFFDGYIARKYQLTTRLGTILDPIMDKFFVVFVLSVLLHEQMLDMNDVAIMLSRDLGLAVFGIYLLLTNSFSSFKFKAIWCGKISTCLQLFTIFFVVQGWAVPTYVYTAFIALGFLAIVELYYVKRKTLTVRYTADGIKL